MQISHSSILALTFSVFSFLSTGPQLVSAEEVSLSPANTSIEFVGSHIVPNKPDPNARKGTFKKFSGTATLAGSQLQSVFISIETASLSTSIPKLNGHLKNSDFFSVRQYPKAVFSSTKIESTGKDKVKITGKLTLLKETKTITFPATVKTGGKLTLDATFEIDRSQYGMNYGLDKVEKNVAMTVKING